MAKQKSSLKSPVTFSLGTVLLFVLVFGAVGGYAIWKSFAASRLPSPPRTASTATCKPVSPISIGQTYAGTITGLPTDYHDYNILAFYPDGSTGGYAVGYGAFPNGTYNIEPFLKATMSGTTKLQLTDYVKKKNTYVYATCYIQVN